MTQGNFRRLCLWYPEFRLEPLGDHHPGQGLTVHDPLTFLQVHLLQNAVDTGADLHRRNPLLLEFYYAIKSLDLVLLHSELGLLGVLHYLEASVLEI